MKLKRILLVDDDPAFRVELNAALEGVYEVETAESVTAFHDLYRPYGFDLVIMDMRLEREREGLDLVRTVLAADPFQPVIVITAYPDTESYIEAIDAGALMFLSKREFPPKFAAQMVEAVLRQGALQRRVASLEKRLDQIEPGDIVGASAAVRRIKEQIQTASADGEIAVLVRGESGTGKELVAQNIHRLGRKRGQGPFVAVSVAGLHRESVHSDLFGHEKGAFTGAHSLRKGFIEEAHGGVLFLDEIGDLSPEAQIKLLRVLETRSFQRLGGNRPITVDFQLVTATHQDLEQSVKTGGFRQDLYYRLQAFEIFLPPLRERREDISLLAQHFLHDMRNQGRTTARTMTSAMLQALELHKWPGNVRELRNVIEYSAIQAAQAGAGELTPLHLPASLRAAGVSHETTENEDDYQRCLARAELQLVASTVQRYGTTRKTELAQHLHYNDRFTFVRRIGRIVDRYPDVATAYPEIAALFGKTRDE